MKSERITRNTVNQNDAFDFKIHHEWIFDRRNCVDEKHLKEILVKTRNRIRRKHTRKSFEESWKASSNKFDCVLHRCCIRFEDKSFDCIMCSVSQLSCCIQNVKFRNRNEHRWCEVICNRKSSKMIKNAAKFRSHMNFHRQSKCNSTHRKIHTFSCRRNLQNDWKFDKRAVFYTLNSRTRRYIRKRESRSTRKISFFVEHNYSR
jgi:hypothetical protein